METRLNRVIAEIETLDDTDLDQVLAFVADLKSMRRMNKDNISDARNLRNRLEAKYGTDHFGSIASMIDEAREERLNDLMGRD